MANRIKLHPETPHQKRIYEIADLLKNDDTIMLFPTDSQYALGCDYKNKKGIDRIRKIRNLGKNDHLSVMCYNLENVSTFANLTDENFKLIKRLIPGPYTFILPATREVPRLLQHPKKRTVGIRVPDYEICLDIIKAVGHPLTAITARLDEVEYGNPAESNREMFLSRFDKMVDIIIDNQQKLPADQTTILDLTNDQPVLLRKGLGLDFVEETLAYLGYEMEEGAVV
ncbi:MAG: L-threonylcarbamoyladenylate synthase [Balneolaceae bacterium]